MVYTVNIQIGDEILVSGKKTEGFWLKVTKINRKTVQVNFFGTQNIQASKITKIKRNGRMI